jgi:transcriptional regulator with XRE-family HTH domain
MTVQSFWDRTNGLIKERKTTQRAISVQCGFTARRVETLVSNGRLPDAIEAQRIAAALGTTVEYLVTGKEPDASRKYREALEEIRDITNKSL